MTAVIMADILHRKSLSFKVSRKCDYGRFSAHTGNSRVVHVGIGVDEQSSSSFPFFCCSFQCWCVRSGINTSDRYLNFSLYFSLASERGCICFDSSLREPTQSLCYRIHEFSNSQFCLYRNTLA
jgi:hypothetical protein